MAAITSAGRATAFEPLEPAVDSSAAAALYERHSSQVFGYCLSRLGRREDAEDAVQTTFMHAVRGLHRGIVPTTEVAWLLGIARNVCLARWETVGRRSRLESPCDPHELDRAGAEPEESVFDLIGVENALRKLPDQQRRAVLLRDWRGLSYEEIAVQLGISHASVETLIFRGRRTLAELLREEPQTVRSRLQSLGSLGSFLSAIKTALTGGAAATKIAMAAMAAVALSGAGAVGGTTLVKDDPAPVQAPAPRPVSVVPSVTPQSPASVESGATRAPAAQNKPTNPAASPAVGSAPAAAPATPTLSVPAAAAPAAENTTRAPSSAEAQATPQASALPPAPVVVVPPAEALVPKLTGVVETTVNTLLTSLPVQLPPVALPPLELPPVVLPPVEVPPVQVQVPIVPAILPQVPVTVTLPPIQLTPPIQITPPKLLP